MISEDWVRQIVEDEIRHWVFPAIAQVINERIAALEQRTARLEQVAQASYRALDTSRSTIDLSREVLRQQASRHPSPGTVKHLTSIK